MLRTWLVMNGFEVTEAADGDAAVAETLRTEPDVLLLDASLPKIDSLSVVRALRGCGSAGTLPIVLISGFTGTGREQEARAAGCSAYLEKPVDLERLLHLLIELSRHDAEGPRPPREASGSPTEFATGPRTLTHERSNPTEH